LNVVLIAALVLAIVAAVAGPTPPAVAADRPLKAADRVKLKAAMIRYPCGNAYALEPAIPAHQLPFKPNR
jgi:hypothetical protein